MTSSSADRTPQKTYAPLTYNSPSPRSISVPSPRVIRAALSPHSEYRRIRCSLHKQSNTFVFAIVLPEHFSNVLFALLLGGNPSHYAHELRKTDTTGLLLIVLRDDIIHYLLISVEAIFLQRKSQIAGVQDALASRVNLVEHLLYHDHVVLGQVLRNIKARVKLIQFTIYGLRSRISTHADRRNIAAL